jgi:hypothetical protein
MDELAPHTADTKTQMRTERTMTRTFPAGGAGDNGMPIAQRSPEHWELRAPLRLDLNETIQYIVHCIAVSPNWKDIF